MKESELRAFTDAWTAYTAQNEELDKIDNAWSLDIDNKALENRWDEAYKETQSAFIEAVKEFCNLTGIDHKSGRYTLMKYPYKVNYLIKHWKGAIKA